MKHPTALLVVDVQRAFYDGEPIPAVFNSDQTLQNIVEVIRKARVSELPVVYVQHTGASGHPLEKGGKGWQVHPAVEPEATDVVVGKTTPDSFHETGLKQVLDDLGVNRLIVVGNQTDFCIDTTCRRAKSLGYSVTLLEDSHSTWDHKHLAAPQIIQHHNFVLGRQFVTLADSNSVDLEAH